MTASYHSALFQHPLSKPDVSVSISSGFPVPHLPSPSSTIPVDVLRVDGHDCLRVYVGVAMTEDEYRALKPGWIATQYDDLDDALGYAAQMFEQMVGACMPWEIEGDDGITIGRGEIARTVVLRWDELEDTPRAKPLSRFS